MFCRLGSWLSPYVAARGLDFRRWGRQLQLRLTRWGEILGPSVVIPAAALSLIRHPDTHYIFFGRESEIREQMSDHSPLAAVSRIVHTDVAVSNEREAEPGSPPRTLEKQHVARSRCCQERRGARCGFRGQHRRLDGDGALLPAHAARHRTPCDCRRCGQHLRVRVSSWMSSEYRDERSHPGGQRSHGRGACPCPVLGR